MKFSCFWNFYILPSKLQKIIRLLAFYVCWRSIIRLRVTDFGRFLRMLVKYYTFAGVLRMLAKYYTFAGVLRLLALHPPPPPPLSDFFRPGIEGKKCVGVLPPPPPPLSDFFRPGAASREKNVSESPPPPPPPPRSATFSGLARHRGICSRKHPPFKKSCVR